MKTKPIWQEIKETQEANTNIEDGELLARLLTVIYKNFDFKSIWNTDDTGVVSNDHWYNEETGELITIFYDYIPDKIELAEKFGTTIEGIEEMMENDVKNQD